MASVAKREWTHKGEKRVAWVVRFKDHDDKKHLRTFEQKKDAESFRLKIATSVERGEVVVTANTTFKQALDLYFDRCRARAAAKDMRLATLENWQMVSGKHIEPRIGRFKLRDLTLRELQKWVDGLAYDEQAPRKRDTIQICACIVRLAFAHAEKSGLCANPLKADKLEIPGRPSQPVAIPTKEEVSKLLAASGGKSSGVGRPLARYLRPAVFMAVFSGLRSGEMLALRWDAIDFEKRIIRVREGVDRNGRFDLPKTAAGVRDVPIAPPLLKVLKEWRLASPISPFVFPPSQHCGKNVKHPTVHQSAFKHSWRMLQKRVFGTNLYHFHSLRHVAASLLIEAGLPPKRIQTIMGHASITMTFDRYGHLFEDPNLVRDAMDKIGIGLVA